MRILQVANGFPPVDRGGVEIYTLALSKALRSQGHQVTVFCREPGPDRPPYSVRDDVTEGIPVRFVVNHFDAATPFAPRYYDRRMETLFNRVVEGISPAVIHFQHTQGLSASLLSQAIALGVPFVVTLHDYWYMCPQVNLLRPDYSLCLGSHREVNCYECIYGCPEPPPGPHTPDFNSVQVEAGSQPVEHRPLGLSDAVYYPLQRTLPAPVRRALLDLYDVTRLRLVPRLRSLLDPKRGPDMKPLRVRARYMQGALIQCGLLIAPSRVAKAQYVRFGIPEAQVRVIPHGMDMSIWEGFESVARPRRAGATVRFGYIGSLLRHKGVDLIIRAFQQLDVPDTELRIHGFELAGDPFARVLHNMADMDPRVHFAGSYLPQELPHILSQIDVLLIPSRWHETFSLVTREAVLAGLPVIASRMGGILDAIEDGVNGILMPAGDLDAWGAAMRRMVQDPDLIAAFHRAQLTRSVKSMVEHADELARIYEGLLG